MSNNNDSGMIEVNGREVGMASDIGRDESHIKKAPATLQDAYDKAQKTKARIDAQVKVNKELMAKAIKLVVRDFNKQHPCANLTQEDLLNALNECCMIIKDMPQGDREAYLKENESARACIINKYLDMNIYQKDNLVLLLRGHVEDVLTFKEGK